MKTIIESAENIAAVLQKKIDECEYSINYFKHLNMWDKVQEYAIKKEAYRDAKTIVQTLF